MGTTNGFLRLDGAAFAQLAADRAAFERKARDYASPDYFDMDKAGLELYFLFDPPDLEGVGNRVTAWPGLVGLLMGGETVHPDLDLGFGPPRRVGDGAMRAALDEWRCFSFEKLVALAQDETAAGLLLGGSDEETLRTYHWPYLQGLVAFTEETLSRGMVLLRY